MSTEHPDDIVLLAKAQNSAQAHLWEQVLKEEDIQCQVVGDFLGGGIGNIPGIRSELWVHKDDVEKAKEILSRHEDSSDEES